MVNPIVFVPAAASMEDKVSSVRAGTNIRKAPDKTGFKRRGIKTFHHIAAFPRPDANTASSKEELTDNIAVVLLLI